MACWFVEPPAKLILFDPYVRERTLSDWPMCNSLPIIEIAGFPLVAVKNERTTGKELVLISMLYVFLCVIFEETKNVDNVHKWMENTIHLGRSICVENLTKITLFWTHMW